MATTDRPHRAGRPADRDAALLPRLRDDRDRRPRAAGRARRPQAGAPPRALRDVRRRLPPGPRLQQVRRASSATSWASTTRTATRAIYDALVRLVQDWSLRYPLVDGPGQLRLARQRPGAPPRGTPSAGWRRSPWRWSATSTRRPSTSRTTTTARPRSRRPAGPVPEPAGQRLRRHRRRHGHQHPAAQPARGRRRRAVVPPEPGRPAARSCSRSSCLRIKGPDFPTGALILGRKGIEDAYRTGRGSITMRAVVDGRGDPGPHSAWWSPSCRTRSTPTTWPMKIAELVKDGKIAGIADIRDETSGRTGQRLVIVLKRDAVAKVVLNNLYKHTQLQDNFGANMLALVDGVPRTLPPRRVRPALGRPPDRGHRAAHPLPAAQGRGGGPHPARPAQGARRARRGHRPDPRLGHGRRRPRRPDGAARHRRAAGPGHPRHAAAPAGRPRAPEDRSTGTTSCRRRSPTTTRSWPRPSASATIVCDGAGRDRRQVRRRPAHQDRALRRRHVDRGPHPRGGHRRHDHPRRLRQAHQESTSTARSSAAARACEGAQLRGDDIVEHFFITTTHHWLLFFTNLGRVYRAKAYELPEAGRDAKGQHVANLLAFQPGRADRPGPGPARLRSRRRTWCSPPAQGLVKKTRLTEYDTNRVRRRHRDQPARGRRAGLGAGLASSEDDLLAGLAQGPVGALHRRRRGPAADGPRHLRRHRHEVPRRRRPAVDERGARRRGPGRVRGLRERPGQADRSPRHTGSRAGRPSASRWPRSPSVAATWSAR